MASNIGKTVGFRYLKKRTYAQLSPISGTTNYDVKLDVLPNKLKVVTAENDSAISRVSVTVKAGSRNENSENLGVTHLLRVCAGLSTKNASQFAITRNIQQVGANLSATSDRETISYTLEGTRSAIEKALPFFTEVVSQQVFKPWEVADQSNRLKLDLAVRPLQLRAIDLLHKAAYRRGLGNSLYIPKFQIGRMSTETLQHYVATNFTAPRAAVVGLGLEHGIAMNLAQNLCLGEGEGQAVPSPYLGGELRSDKGGDMAFVAVAGEGSGVTNLKSALAAAVLAKAISVGPQIPWSTNDNGLLSKSVSGGCPEPWSAVGISAAYADTGLVGVLLAVPANAAAKLVEGAVKVLKSGSVSDADVQRGKNQLKTSVLLDAESGRTAVHNLGVQAVLAGSAMAPKDIGAAIDSITTSDVQSVLSKAGSKLSIASVGNLTNVPYIDELC